MRKIHWFYRSCAYGGSVSCMLAGIHSPMFAKRYNNDPKYAGNTPAGLKAPLHESAYVEGGSLAYLLRGMRGESH
jgi:hypothetical protein